MRKAKFSGREFSSYSVPKILVFVFVFIFNAQAGTDTPALAMGPKEPVGLVAQGVEHRHRRGIRGEEPEPRVSHRMRVSVSVSAAVPRPKAQSTFPAPLPCRALGRILWNTVILVDFIC